MAAPGRGLDGRASRPRSCRSTCASRTPIQSFNVGPASCGAYGTTLGVAQALERFGTLPLGDLAAGPGAAAREGVEVEPMQAFLFEILEPILTSTPECAALYAPDGRLLGEGDTLRLPELGDLLERLGREGPGFLYTGDVARSSQRLGARARRDAHARGPGRLRGDRARARAGAYRGREVLTNPPPSSGGILIADALGILERLDEPARAGVVAR